MQLNTDFERVVMFNTLELPWHPLAAVGVSQRLLESVGTDRLRATSIVRYAANSPMPTLAHETGDEIIVLEGEFSDEGGIYTGGTYIKNIKLAKQTAYTKNGCVLFVKQGHLQADDAEHVVVDVSHRPWRQGLVAGLSVMPLSDYKGEHSALVRWQPGTVFSAHRHWGGEEIYVLDGVFEDEFGRYPKGTWLRNPHMSQHSPFSREGCTIFVKVGHLPEARNVAASQ